MNHLSEALADMRNRLFVGREAELLVIHDWLDRQDAPTEVLFITGMGGIGKSALMRQFLNIAKHKNVWPIYLDAQSCTETPAGFLALLKNFLTQKTLDAMSYTSMQDMINALTSNKVLLCIDNYKSLCNMESWLREVFLPQFSATGLLVVLASRQDLAFHWHHNLAWQGRVRQMKLAPLSKDETRQFYEKTGLDKKMAFDPFISNTRGLPLAMILSVRKLQFAKLKSEALQWSISLHVNSELLREITSTPLKEAVEILCIMPQASPEWLGRLLTPPLNTMNLHQLSQISFVNLTSDGFSLHDVAHTFLTEDFARRDPVHYRELRLRIIEELVKGLEGASDQEKKRMAASLLSIRRDAFRLNAKSIMLSKPDSSLRMDSFRNSDLSHEQKQPDMSPEADGKLLDSLAVEFPESIRVIRAADNVPLGYTTSLLLYKETVSFLEHHLPGVLHACFSQKLQMIKQLQLEQADTYIQLILGCTHRKNDYSFHELIDTFMTDSIFLTYWGPRVILSCRDDTLSEFLQHLGFRTLSIEWPKAHPLYGTTIHFHDWRSSDSDDDTLALYKSPPNTRQMNENHKLTVKDIKEALPMLDNLPALEQTGLAYKLHYNGPELQKKLQSIIFQDPHFPLNKRTQSLLQLSCQMPYLTAEMAADRLHISRATYYRTLHKAMIELEGLLLH